MSGLTRDDVVRMAREAEFQEGWTNLWTENFARFASLAYAAGQAAEREACAVTCEELPAEWTHEENEHDKCAAAIRARGHQ